LPTLPPDGFAEFVAARSAALLRTAWLLTGDAGRAEDLLQTALAASWRRWRHVVAGGYPEAYVRRAIVTAYLSWWRRRWRAEVPATVKVQAHRGLRSLRTDPDLSASTAEEVGT
jgi:DNA-directed RNA polymerase specialized sigma24 family protein